MKFIQKEPSKKKEIILLLLFLQNIKYYEEGIFNIIKDIIIPKFNINDKCLYLNYIYPNFIILQAKVFNKYIENDKIKYEIKYKIDNYFELKDKQNNYNSKYKIVSEYSLRNK